MSEDCEGERLHEAYENLDYELVPVSEKLKVPSSTPARFVYERPPITTDADELRVRFDESRLTLIDVLAQNGEDWYEFSISGKVFTKTEEFASITVSTAGVTVLKKDQDLSFEGFREIVEAIEFVLKVDLEYEEADADD